jgi:hypothetical protein
MAFSGKEISQREGSSWRMARRNPENLAKFAFARDSRSNTVDLSSVLEKNKRRRSVFSVVKIPCLRTVN